MMRRLWSVMLKVSVAWVGEILSSMRMGFVFGVGGSGGGGGIECSKESGDVD